MKTATAALTFLSSLAFASGFAPGFAGRRDAPLRMTDEVKQQGSVKWFSRIKGFGFILPDDESGDLFVHQTNIEVEGFRSLDENQRVEFAIAEGEDGKKRATEVVAIDP
mmetsp:Transcript_5025/g.9116  ORF Transcript_5025/g.9116 Transcript_5025/m.9116 type:complete len:109 (-) Transcript_5025:603-929(-)|eukprot:CAMPEP_0201601750 /NCGR_PEP_ID=MMETSP0492-20130828/2648_1 /ASSEMBLY_ACC=CAM_ASM_000837 /TAXON_ID=420259 /ORGANISM="Thalassiosira gravida, Strain GMp14c1" /LENGTH=108 /DNA_ID=CAMNT_0048065071 /DNA_START=47 /DNA_END=376 /DNA_ORIENTATION=-